MRKQFIEMKTRKAAETVAPWACVIVKVNGGFHAFESRADYGIWRKQK
jgi:hypothetical protein